MSNEKTLSELRSYEAAIRDSLFADDLTEEDRAALIENWMSAEADVKDKTESYCAVLARFDSESNMLREEEMRLANRRHILEGQKMRFTQRWADIMLGDQASAKIDNGLHTVSFKRNGSVELLVTPSKLPESCIVVRESKAASLTKVRELLDADDITIKGCARFRHTVQVN